MCVNVLFKDIFSYYVNHFSERIELTFKLLITTKNNFLESDDTVKIKMFKMRAIVLNLKYVHLAQSASYFDVSCSCKNLIGQ